MGTGIFDDIDISTGLIETIPREREGILSNYEDAVNYISKRLETGLTPSVWENMYVLYTAKTHFGNTLRPWQFSVNVLMTGIGPYRGDMVKRPVSVVIDCWSHKRIVESLYRFLDVLGKYIVYKDESVMFKKVVVDLVDDIVNRMVVTYLYDDNDEYTV